MVLSPRSALRGLTVVALVLAGTAVAAGPATASSCTVPGGSTTVTLTIDSATQVRTSGGIVQYRPTPTDPRDQSGSWSSCPSGTALTVSSLFGSVPTLLLPLSVPATIDAGFTAPQLYAADPASAVTWTAVDTSASGGGALLDVGDGGTTKDVLLQNVDGQVHLGLTSGDDVVDLSPATGSAFNAEVDAGDGNDTVTGNDSTVSVLGGPGDDTIHLGTFVSSATPGDGADTVTTGATDALQLVFLVPDDAADHVTGQWGGCDVTFDTDTPVSVSLNNKADDGAAGEGDDIRACTNIGGGNGADVLDPGTSGHEVWMFGVGGDDRFVDAYAAGRGTHRMIGGPGSDTVDLSAAGAALDAHTQQSWGSDYAFEVVPGTGGGTDDRVLAGQVETLKLGSGEDTADLAVPGLKVAPGTGDDGVTLGAAGMSYVAGAGVDGNDRVSGSVAGTTADYSARTSPLDLSVDALGGDGAVGEDDDLIGVQNVVGGSAADTLVGDVRANSLRGGSGADTILGRGGADILTGDGGADVLNGNGGDDLLRGLAAADTLFGGSGDDRLEGDSGLDEIGAADTLVGGPGDDDVLGFAGNDELDATAGDDGSDLMVGGAGTDRADYSARTSAVSITLDTLFNDGAPGEGDKVVVENLVGGSGADTLTGDNAANDLTGGAGRDVLKGSGGNDTFRTRDRLVDNLNGGSGTDRANRDDTDVVALVEQRF